MRFFRTKLYPDVFSGNYGIYFIASEVPPGGKRKFSVRKFDPETISVCTCGMLCELTKYQALKNAVSGFKFNFKNNIFIYESKGDIANG